MGVENIAALCAVPGVIGVKSVTRNALRLAEAIAACAPRMVCVGVLAEELKGTNVMAVKASLIAQGLGCGPTRPPSAWPLTGAQDARMHDFLSTNDLT